MREKYAADQQQGKILQDQLNKEEIGNLPEKHSG